MNKSEKFWDRLAVTFDKRDKDFEQTHSKTVAKAEKYLKISDVVLDYGCATGTAALEVADKVKEVHGIDISCKMIEGAKRKAAEHKIENVDFTQATIFDERYKGESFDVILAFNILLHVEDTPMVLKRINELLKPGGLIISVTACMGEKKTFFNFLIFLIKKIGIFPDFRFFKISELENSITDGKFQIVETEVFKDSPMIYFIAARKSIIE
jgi:2-polyprenyl-3-methyl-5-hydroxy-6-metoxy-1,4-benzoquinol methylase